MLSFKCRWCNNNNSFNNRRNHHHDNSSKNNYHEKGGHYDDDDHHQDDDNGDNDDDAIRLPQHSPATDPGLDDTLNTDVRGSPGRWKAILGYSLHL